MKRSHELKRYHSQLINEAESVHQHLSRGGLTAEQIAAGEERFREKLAAADDLLLKIEAAEADEKLAERTRIARMAKTPTELQFDETGARPFSPADANVLLPTLRAFRGDREQAVRDAYDCGLWFKATVLRDAGARNKLLSRRGEAWLASQNENDPVRGGYLVPPQLERAIIVSREQVGAVRRLATIFPMTSDTLHVPKETGAVSVYYPSEEGEITPSEAQFGRVALTAKKRAVLTYVSSELNDDALVPLADYLARAFGHALALREDQEGIAGDGTSSYGGVRGVLPAVSDTAGVFTAGGDHDAWSELDFSDFAGTMSLVPDKYRVPGQLAWLCSAPFKWQVMDRLAIGANGALSQVLVEGVPQEMFLGYPVVISDRMPTASAAGQVCCLFGNFGRAVALGERSGIRLAISEHVAFTSDRLAIRATTRYDLAVHEAGDATTPGAIVGLSTHS